MMMVTSNSYDAIGYYYCLLMLLVSIGSHTLTSLLIWFLKEKNRA